MAAEIGEDILNKLDTPKKRLIDALLLSHGVVTSACDAAGIPRSTYYFWLKEDEVFKEAVNDVQEVAIDFVEGHLYSKIGAGDTIATIFYLKTRAKKRGYVERTELTGPDGKDLNYNVTLDLGGNKRDTNEPVSGSPSQ